jgi:hypothetical protein
MPVIDRNDFLVTPELMPGGFDLKGGTRPLQSDIVRPASAFLTIRRSRCKLFDPTETRANLARTLMAAFLLNLFHIR